MEFCVISFPNVVPEMINVSHDLIVNDDTASITGPIIIKSAGVSVGFPDTGRPESGCPAIGREDPRRVNGCKDTGDLGAVGSQVTGGETQLERTGDQNSIDTLEAAPVQV